MKTQKQSTCKTCHKSFWTFIRTNYCNECTVIWKEARAVINKYVGFKIGPLSYENQQAFTREVRNWELHWRNFGDKVIDQMTAEMEQAAEQEQNPQA